MYTLKQSLRMCCLIPTELLFQQEHSTLFLIVLWSLPDRKTHGRVPGPLQDRFH